LNVSTSQPSQSLVILAEYIMKVYAPLWFAIKLKPQVLMVLLICVRLFIYHRSYHSLRDVVDKCIQQNGYYGHPENASLYMMT